MRRADLRQFDPRATRAVGIVVIVARSAEPTSLLDLPRRPGGSPGAFGSSPIDIELRPVYLISLFALVLRGLLSSSPAAIQLIDLPSSPFYRH
jgi:hypothetical protein